MLSPNNSYNETGLTMQTAGPVREEWQPIQFSYLFKGSEFGHWKVIGGHDAFAFRYPSLAQTEVRQFLDSEAHHHKISPIGTGRLIAMVGVAHKTIKLGESPSGPIRPSSHHYAPNKEEQKRAACGPDTPPLQPQSYQVLQTQYLDLRYGIEPMDAAVQMIASLPTTFLLKDMWMFGITTLPVNCQQLHGHLCADINSDLEYTTSKQQ